MVPVQICAKIVCLSTTVMQGFVCLSVLSVTNAALTLSDAQAKKESTGKSHFPALCSQAIEFFLHLQLE